MNYEKKYKEALERARVWKEKSGMPKDKQGILDDIFPELKDKDSEDEQIRKALVDFMTIVWGNQQNDICGVNVEDAIAWLEKQGKKKYAWSEEDESLRLRTIGALETCKIGSPTKCVDEQINWLKSLKDRYTWKPSKEQKPAWNEDESIISDLLDYFDEDKCLKHEVNDIVKWLKTIKPQQKGWSDNEIKMFDNLITYLDGRKGLLEEIKRTYIDWLKSIKSRVKPKQEWSEEDQYALEDVREAVVHYWGGDSQDILLYWLKSIKQKIKGE